MLGNIAVPPERTTIAYKAVRELTSYFVIVRRVVLRVPQTPYLLCWAEIALPGVGGGLPANGK
jgi:hypothetical protein